jgi:4-hydroxymandelate oxidase
MRAMGAHPANQGPPRATGRTTEDPPAGLLDLSLLEADARRVVGEMAYAYFAGGAEDERLLADNEAAWGRWLLRPSVLRDVSDIDTTTTVVGTAMEVPFLVAPTALHCLAHLSGEVETARGAARGRSTMVLSTVSTCSMEEVASAAQGPRWMQIYVLKDRGRTKELVDRAVAAGYRALVLTADAPVPGARRREVRQGVHLPADLSLPNLGAPSTSAAHHGGFMEVVGSQFDPSLTEDDVGWLASLSGLAVLVKGVLRGDDAVRCLEAGASGVVVSNHGGRQLDQAPATADVLEEVVEAVGDRGEVLVDGGIRRGSDVAKAIALGASAVLVGRPVLWALATDGAAGVARLLEWLGEELRRTMALCGARSLSHLDRSMVARRPPP